MKNIYFILIFIISQFDVKSQTNFGNTFSGTGNVANELCADSKGAFTDEKVNKLIEEVLRVSNLKNRFIVMPCSSIPNCQAIYYGGKPYILYNASFLDEVKRLSFSEKDIVLSDRNWEVLTIVSHEIGHHFNNHLNNPPPGVTAQQLELEADEFAGSTIFMLGGTLAQAQSAFKNLSPTASYTHPGREERINAISKGWNEASQRSINKRVVKSIEPAVVTKIYNSVKIGEQVWMSENLSVEQFQNGELILQAKTIDDWIVADKEKRPVWCYYGFNPIYGNKYGKIYNRHAILDPRGLAPLGWHIPSASEFYSLKNTTSKKGTKVLKSQNLWNSQNKNVGTNETGFSALPGGLLSIGKFFSDKEEPFIYESNATAFWTITLNENKFISIAIIEIQNNYLSIEGSGYTADGFYVRCIKD